MEKKKNLKELATIGLVVGVCLVIQLVGLLIQQYSVKELDVGEELKYTFGNFSITGFKRENDGLYFSYKIVPKEGTNTLTLDEVSYFMGDKEYPLSSLSVGSNYIETEQSSRIKGIDASKVTAIALNYDDTRGKWNLDPNEKSGGDVINLETLIAFNPEFIQEKKAAEQKLLEAQQKAIEEKKAQEELQKQQEEIQRQQQEELEKQQQEAAKAQIQQQDAQLQEQREAEQAQREAEKAQREAEKAYEKAKRNAQFTGGEVVEYYGKTVYPYGFKLHNWMGVYGLEQNSDGSWFLKASCDVTNEYGATANDLTCEATIRAIGDPEDVNGWSVESFNVY